MPKSKIRYGIYNRDVGTITEFLADEGDTISIVPSNRGTGMPPIATAKRLTIKIEDIWSLC
jgi:hypothetical protein